MAPTKLHAMFRFFKKIEATPTPQNETDDEVEDPIPSVPHQQEQTVGPQQPRRSQRQRQLPNRLAYQ